jgi:hypothetical protein
MPNICRCGAYIRIRRAIARAAEATPGPVPNQTVQDPSNNDPARFTRGSSEQEQVSPANRI